MRSEKICSLTAAAVLCASMFAACGGNTPPAGTAGTAGTSAAENPSEVTENSADDTADTVSDESTVTENENLSVNDEIAGTASDTPSQSGDAWQTDLAELNALELSELMGNGIDLGNTHEAYGHGSHSWDTDPTVFEGLWGQPVTTQEIISGMKESGFDTVRIPVAWTNAMNYESGDYTINPKFLDRIEEVVSYAINADMFVMINDHWDGSWWGMFGSETQEMRDKAMDMYISMWQQICERFRDYPDKLIFESANEELGDRLNDKDVAKDSGALSKSECYETANKINQTFVDTVRASGGNNDDRFLLIAGYNTDIANTCDQRFRMPEDTANGKLLVSVHYYTPADYCINGSAAHWGTVKQYEEMNELLKKMTMFTDQGYGVIIGEYGVLTNGGSDPREDSGLWFNNFLDNCDLYNYVPVLWDCNDLYSKQLKKIKNDEVSELFRSRSNAAREGMTSDEITSAAEENMSLSLKAAEERVFDTGDVPLPDDNTAVAWIMYQSADYGISYSVGDEYNPVSKSMGIAETNPVITGPGEYTASLDFSDAGIAKGTAFCALGISNAETLFPGCIADIKSIKINDEEVEFSKGYTTSDNGKCTRVNLYNQWVSKVPGDARTADGNTEGITANMLDISDKKIIRKLSVTFEFITAE